MSKFDELLKKLKIDETYTRPIKKLKDFNSVKENIPLKANFNFGCDLFTYLFDRQANKHIIETVVASSIQAAIPSMTDVVANMVYSDDTLIRFNINFYIRDGLKTQNSICTIEVNL
jgi:hypothetical protein